MSGWDAYVRNLLECEPGRPIKKAAIISNTDGSVWTKSDGTNLGENFTATDDELRTLVSQFNKLSDVFTTGIVLERNKYIVAVADEASSLVFAKRDKSGLIAAKTNQTIVIAIFEGLNDAGITARGSVEKIAHHLKDSGY